MTTAFAMFPHTLHELLTNNPELHERFSAMEEQTNFEFRLDQDRAFFDRFTRIVTIPVICFSANVPQSDRRFFATFQVAADFDSAKLVDFAEFPTKSFNGPFAQTFFAAFFSPSKAFIKARKSA